MESLIGQALDRPRGEETALKKYDRTKVEETVMALLFLTSFRDGPATRAWKGHDWGVMDGLYERGWIHDPKGKARSVVLTEEGRRMASELFERQFGLPVQPGEAADEGAPRS